MAKPLLIKRIDLLAHPFYDPRLEQGSPPIPYNKEQAGKLLEIWKQHVDEAAKDPNRLLFISPTLRQTKWQAKLSRQLVNYARKRLGERFGFFRKQKAKFPFHDQKGFACRVFEDFTGRRFKVNPNMVKTRGFGEYTNSCVVDYLTELNLHVGLPEPIPYRNRQSAVLLRKSVGADFKPWELKELLKTAEGRRKLRENATKYILRRREKANALARKLGKKPFKPRQVRRKP